MAEVLERAKFVMADVGNNNNKLWQYTVYDDGSVLCEWGRIGKGLQSKTFSGGVHYAHRKAKEKENKGYKRVDTIDSNSSITQGSIINNNSHLAEIAKKQIKTNNPETEKLIEYLTKVNAHTIHDATGGKIVFNNDSGLFQTPVGIVSKNNITEARNILAKLVDHVKKQDFNSAKMKRLVSDYLMLIPQEVGRKLTCESFLPNMKSIDNQNDILDSLETSYTNALVTEDQSEQLDVEEKTIFNVELNVVDDQKTLNKIKRLYGKTRQSKHACYHLDVHKVYAVTIEEKGSKIGNIKELWHGTRASNLLSILKGGFVIPPANAAHCTGRMFYNGVYFSDQSTKSLNYAFGYWRGNKYNNCFMFLADVAMGKQYIPSGPMYHPLPKGYDSCFAKAGYSGVINNEMIVYNVSQINPLYLVEFK